MKNAFVILLLIGACSFTPVHAELIWKPGYVILNSGDSVKGEIKINTKKELPLFQKVYYRDGKVSKTYKPEQVKEYGFETTKFFSRKVDGEFQFMKALTLGALNFYEWQYEIQKPSGIVLEKEYYIEKNDGASKIERVKSGKFKKIVADLMADHTELVQRVQSEDKKYDAAEMQKVVEEYNEWYVEENGKAGN
ncbi:MAG TPA: hypothetical protein VI731_05835 [Bacteroidia bacterium]|nr:hypothetical protein [Bacteroidia bacterium]